MEWQPGTQVVWARSQICPILQSRSLSQPDPVTHSPTFVSQKPTLLQSSLVTQPTLTWQDPLRLQTTGAPASWGQALSLLHRHSPARSPRVSQWKFAGHSLSSVQLATITTPFLHAVAPRAATTPMTASARRERVVTAP